MSSEFTIDIQLTELAFPELFQDEAVAKEMAPFPVSADSTCTPLIPQNSATTSPLSSNIHTNSASPGHIPPTATNTSTKQKHTSNPTQQITSQSSENRDQSPPSSNVDIGPGTDTQPNLAESKNVKHIVNAGVSQMPDPKPNTVTAHKHIKTIIGRRGEERSNTGVGGGSTGSKEQEGRPKNKDSTNEAGQSSEETDDSDVSEEEEEEEEEEEAVATDASVDGSTEQRCKVCDVTLPSAFRLQEHMHLHSGERPHRCAECGKQFCHLANYRAHLRSHAQAVSVRCRVCEASFNSEEKLQLHLENSHLEKEFYQCDFCKRIFTCLNECHRHVDQHRREPLRHQCPKCECSFRRRKSLLRHMEKHSGRLSYLCTDCGQAFSRKNVLFRHSFSHLGLLPYTCVRCRRHFRLASLYHKHVCEPDRIQCVACLGFFSSQEDFQRHKEETGCWGHQGARGDEIRCMECGQAFPSKEELKKHGGAHQRVLTCSECGMGFRSALLLMSHMGGHAGQRPCLCQRCGLGFPHQQAYDSHRRDCGCVPRALVAAKKQKESPSKAPLMTAQSKVVPTGVWKLTLDKHPPPGATLVMFVPAPGSTSSPSLSECMSTESISCSPVGDLKMQGPLTQAVRGTVSSPVAAAVVGASPDSQEKPSGATHHGSLHVPGTTLKLQISKATFVQGPRHSMLPWSSTADNGTQPWDAPLPHGTAAGSTLPQVTGRIMGASTVPSAKAGVPAATTDLANTIEQATSKHQEGSGYEVKKGIVKEERVIEEDDSRKTGEIEAKTESVQQGNVLSRLKVERTLMAEQMEDTKPVSLKERGETCKPIHLQIELPAHMRSEIALSLGLLQAKKQAGSPNSGWPGLGDTGAGPCTSNASIPVKCETGLDDGMTVEGEGRTQGGLAVGVANEVESRAFTSVEVEIRDEEEEEEQEIDDEPHECVSCGKILLERDLIQHYMQHAVESDSSPHHTSPQDTTGPLSSLSPSTSPPRRKLRPRKRP